MAKVAICDQCGRQQALHLGSLPPGGWVEVQEHSTGANPPALQVCSFGCLGSLASSEQAKRSAAAAAKEARAGGLALVPPAGGPVDLGSVLATEPGDGF